MDQSNLMIALMLVPLASTFILALLPSKHTPRGVYAAIHLIALGATAVIGTSLIVSVLLGRHDIFACGPWFHLDALGCVFVFLICTIGFLTGLYSLPYVKHDNEEGKMALWQVKQYYAFFSCFVFTMLVVALSNNIIMMWIGIEATTLATVFLVGSYNTKLSLEAAWKYVIVCTAGVAFGLYGTLLVYANAADVMSDPTMAAFWTSDLPNAAAFDATLIEISFVFISIGIGTKAGLFPMHTWLPDAHSEAPSPVSALLSGVLLKCAMLVIIRFYILTVEAVGDTFPRTLMLILGIVSVCMAALAVYSQDDLKRKLAYHSCENIGIVALCLGFGGPIGIAAALLHCITHGFTKALLFCVSGNVLMKYGTRDLNKIHGMLRVAPATAIILAIGFFALAGFPPFAMFVSEIMAFTAGVVGGYIWIVVIFAIALTVVIAACVHVVTGSLMGEAPEGMPKKDVSALALVPEVVLVACLVWFGVAMPQPMVNAIEDATAIVLQQPDATIAVGDAPVFNNFDSSSTGAQS